MVGDHNREVEIPCLDYTFPSWEPESTTGHVPLMWPVALNSGLAALICGWAEL